MQEFFGLTVRFFDSFCPTWVVTAVWRWKLAATPSASAPANATTLHLELTAEERREALEAWGPGRRLLVNVSAGKAFRAWPDDRYAAMARHLRATVPDAQVVLLHGPGEGARAAAIAEASLARPLSRTLRFALAMVGTAEFVLTPDTSIVHAASAFRVPTVTLFTRDQAFRWHLYRSPGRDVVTDIPTLQGISTAEAIAAVDAVLAEAGIVRPLTAGGPEAPGRAAG